MGTIVEFYSVPPSNEDIAEPGTCGTRTLVGSLSVNSHRVADLLTALLSTDLKNLAGDGSDSMRSLVVAPSELAKLQLQIKPWSHQGDEFLEEVYEAVNDAIEEATWARRSLLIIVN